VESWVTVPAKRKRFRQRIDGVTVARYLLIDDGDAVALFGEEFGGAAADSLALRDDGDAICGLIS